MHHLNGRSSLIFCRLRGVDGANLHCIGVDFTKKRTIASSFYACHECSFMISAPEWSNKSCHCFSRYVRALSFSHQLHNSLFILFSVQIDESPSVLANVWIIRLEMHKTPVTFLHFKCGCVNIPGLSTDQRLAAFVALAVAIPVDTAAVDKFLLFPTNITLAHYSR